jgi:localization factor PodJL
MRAELPWNVAGIPPEAREAARAAARREGLSVGEWLTRRILRSFSDLGEEPPAMPLDAWGLPASANSRRDTEEMLARVSRSETETSDVYRRIDEQLRGVARRLDSAERSQSENNRVISKTAAEINVAAREQAQAFDQLGSHVVGLGERLERVERVHTDSNMKDAVKGLHQGLSRLADQISQTATQSANQVSALANNLEQLAGRLGQLRNDVEEATNVLDRRMALLESAGQTGAHRLDRVIEDIQGRAEALGAGHVELEQRIAEQERHESELERRESETAERIARLDDSLSHLEARGPDPMLGRRLDGIERSLGDLVGQLENPNSGFEEVVRRLTQRMDAAEKEHRELLAELRANLEPRRAEPPPPPAPPVFETAPLLAEPPPPTFPEGFTLPPGGFDEYGNETAFAPHEMPEPFPPVAEPPPPVEPAAPDFPEPFAKAPEQSAGENFLSAARRSARAAAAQAESAPGSSSFSWGGVKPSIEPEATRSRLLIPGLIGAVIVLALVVAFFYGQHLRSNGSSTAIVFPVKPPVVAQQTTPKAVVPPVAQPATPAQAPLPAPVAQATAPVAAVPVAAPAATAPRPTPRVTGNAPSSPVAAPVRAAPHASQTTPKHVRNAHTIPVQTGRLAPAPMAPLQRGSEAPPHKTSPLDHLTSLANNGNPAAETIVGLRYLDGEGVPANPAEAVRWLTRAAQHGQPVAQARLGTLYEHGQGVPLDMGKAVHWYQAAAQQGNRTAMHNLAVALHQGVGGKPDKAGAALWFSKAANLGLVDSQFNLAVLYERGEGVPQSLLDAYKWYAIAATQGDSESKSRLAVLQTQMSDDDKAAAERAAASFHPTPYNRAANVPPTLADLPPG